jgi:hypothetical protein
MLVEDDAAFLASTGWEHELALDGQFVCLVIRNYPLPRGYQPAHADLLLRLPQGFPDAAPDMFWFHPEVSYADGRVPPATGDRLSYGGRVWQRWSRHLASAWRPGIDNLQTYLRLIRTDLTRAVAPQAA